MAKFNKTAQRRTLSGDNPKLTVNLREIFGQEVTNPAVKEEIKQEILDKILARAERGSSVNGGKWKGYSKRYIESDEFQAFGKSASGPANLRLTGDMLELMDVVSETRNTITIGFDDREDAAKAHGHITGGGNLPRRDFFGLSNDEIRDIRNKFQDEIGGEPGFEASVLLGAINRLVNDGES